MSRSNGLRGLLAAAVLFACSPAWADDFVNECKKGASGGDADTVCTCMSGKVTGATRNDAIAAMQKLNSTRTASGAGMDPKTLPAAQQAGLQAVIAAQSQCMK
jgi:hypothetical protein